MRRDGLASGPGQSTWPPPSRRRVPAPRYRVGAVARWIPRLKAWLPDSLFERFMRRTFPWVAPSLGALSIYADL